MENKRRRFKTEEERKAHKKRYMAAYMRKKRGQSKLKFEQYLNEYTKLNVIVTRYDLALLEKMIGQDCCSKAEFIRNLIRNKFRNTQGLKKKDLILELRQEYINANLEM